MNKSGEYAALSFCVCLKRLLLVVLLGASLAAQQSGVEGVVVDQSSGKPLPRVHVTLMLEGRQDPDELYGAMSDQAGHFSIAGLKPGRYNVVLERTGYAQTPAKETYPSVTVKAGQNAADLKVEMARIAMIVGRVVDEDGDPVAHINVQTMAVPPTKISPSMMRSVYVQTDDRGEFHILAGPGKYYLEASPQRMGSGGPPEVRSDGTSEAIYAPTFYPNAASKERASAIEVEPGHDVEGIEIHLTTAAAQRLLTVSGTLTGIPKGTFAFLMLLPSSPGLQVMSPNMADVGPDGKFTISGLQPGVYDLMAQSTGGPVGLMGRAHFKLDGSDLHLDVALTAPGELTGTVQMAGSANTAKLVVHLAPADGPSSFGGNELSGDVDRDGAFRIPKVRPGRFHLQLEPLPDTAYIKSVDLNGVAAEKGLIEIAGSEPAPRVKVTVALDGAQISGKILDKEGEPDTSSAIRVFLIASAEEVRNAPRIDVEDGTYTAKGIRPGKYRLFLFDRRQLGDDYDPVLFEEATRKLFEAAEEIEIHPGDRVTKDLKEAGDAGK